MTETSLQEYNDICIENNVCVKTDFNYAEAIVIVTNRQLIKR